MCYRKIFNKLFISGYNLSFYDSIIRYFGCIKLKFVIVTKVVCYGINIYIFTNAETDFSLKVLIYTGKYTYSKNYNIYMLNTVKVVCELCNQF